MKKASPGEQEKRRLAVQCSGYLCLFFFLLCAFCALAGNSSAQDFENLANRIKSGSTEEKRQALFEIRNLQSERAARLSIPALRDFDEIVRATAAFSVIYLPKEEAFNALVPNLRDKAEIVRRETAAALGKIQNPNAVIALWQTFQKDRSLEVKNACVIALGEIGDISAVENLTQILRAKPKAKEDFLRRSAARALGQIAQFIQIKQSYAVTPESFLPAKFKLFPLEKYRDLAVDFPPFRAAVAVLIRVLQSSQESADTRREAAFALGTVGDAGAVEILRANLGSTDYYLAEICKESLQKLLTAK